MPPATPGCSAWCNASTCLRCIQRPVTNTAAPATSMTSWAANTARMIARTLLSTSTRRAPKLRLLPHHAATKSTAITTAQRRWSLPRLTPQHGPHKDGQQVRGNRDDADQPWTSRLVGANLSSARRSEPRDQERDHRGRTPRHQRDRDITKAHPDAIAEQPEQGANLQRAAETSRLSRKPAENRHTSTENPARESRHRTAHDSHELAS